MADGIGNTILVVDGSIFVLRCYTEYITIVCQILLPNKRGLPRFLPIIQQAQSRQCWD